MSEPPSERAETEQAIAAALPGWSLLPVPGGAAGAKRVLLMHPELGIAVLEAAAAPGPDPSAALRRRLERARFAERHGGLPPIVRLQLPEVGEASLPDLLSWEFAAHPPIALPRPEGWPETVHAAFQAQPAAATTRAARARERAEPMAEREGRPRPIRGPAHRSAPARARRRRRMRRHFRILRVVLVALFALILAVLLFG
jgi:hypothetical protein